jgi:cation transport protein ChaC
MPIAQTAELIVQGYGQKGPCSAYLENTLDHLHALGIHDRRLARLLREVRRICPQ